MSHQIKRAGGLVRRLAVFTALTATISAFPATATAETEASLRRKIAWQAALDAVGFSPGLIDGLIGPKTRLATREFQRVRGLKKTGELDEATAKALKVDPDNVLGRYTIQQADLAEIGPVPKGWVAKSRMKRLGHASLDAVLAERFHCARHLLRTLNPGKDINRLKAGAKVVVPVVAEIPSHLPKAAEVEINLTEKVMRVVSRDKQLIGLFHCSVAKHKSKLPRGRARVACIVHNPKYSFDPKKWPEVKENIRTTLLIPPGPRNPVGRCWIGLSLSGYGMHGTPNPELIGKTGSHGCFRLANWDAIRLSRLVELGTPVCFVGYPGEHVASRN